LLFLLISMSLPSSSLPSLLEFLRKKKRKTWKKAADLSCLNKRISTSSCPKLTFSAWEFHNRSGEKWSNEIR
jgi:hypothetical protein